ncbi:hypothetical protein [Paenibacillus xerothermodurans]|uniref:Uncharacterized protein n=1 Tax=Paenibacillus xerothermodurans TaxID=1977292 RepID=A0A2W1NPX3_PAEXE|nr:hypothetical protein [Paenibacillus xerothermodurans]PZE21545.1 hypothetical protein CBW46_003560 [Paenibacillus xerothermodurans]
MNEKMLLIIFVFTLWLGACGKPLNGNPNARVDDEERRHLPPEQSQKHQFIMSLKEKMLRGNPKRFMYLPIQHLTFSKFKISNPALLRSISSIIWPGFVT